MAASSHGVGDLGGLSTHLGLPSELITGLASGSEECTKMLLKVKEYCDGQGSKEEKWRSDVANLRRARVNAEQQFIQLERQLISCNTKLEAESKQKSQLQQELDKTATSLAEKQKRLQEVEGIQVEASTNYSRVSKLNEQLEDEKLDLLAVVERKNQEIDTLNEEWKNMSEKLSAANFAKFEAQSKVDEILSQETSFMFREKRIAQEKDLMTKQGEWLNSELKSKTDELTKLRKEKSAQVLELQGQMDEQNEEVVHLKSSVESLKQTNEEMETKMKLFLQKLKDAQEQLAKMEEHYKMELSSQSKLATLYKEEAEEAKGKSVELLSAVEELQKLLKEANNGHMEIESKLQEEQSSHLQSTKDMETKINQLDKELENANDLLAAARQRGAAPMTPQELSVLSPTAAATSSLLKSGMTLTQIYSQYVEVTDSLQEEKDENARLKQYLDQILKEIEEKAPSLKKQRHEYEQALHSVDQLSRRLDSALVEHEELRAEADESRKHCEHLKRENERLKTLSSDLSQQVQVLLKECEEARMGVVTIRSAVPPMSSEEVSSSSQVISQHLVSFRNIEELQQQNQRLLQVIRELSEENEKREGDGAIVEVKKQLDVTLKEVEDLKETRERQMQMVEAVVRQRDMYRVLLSNTGQTPIPLSGMLMSTPLSHTPDKSGMEETRHALNDLQKLFEEYKTEKKSDETKLNERLDKLQDEGTKLHGQNARLTSQLQFEEEKYKMLQSSAERFKKEAAATNEKAQKLQVANSNAQMTVDKYKQELIENRERLNKVEVTFDNMKCERDMLKEAEIRLLQENKSLLDQQKGQNALLTNLQTMQNNLERSNFETRTRLESQAESLQRELTLLKRKVESDHEHHRHVVSTKESRVEELQSQLETEMKSNLEARDRLISITREHETLQLKCTQTEAYLQASERRLEDILTKEPDTNRAAEEEKTRRQIEEQHAVKVQDIEVKLKGAEAKVQVLEDQVEQAKKHTDQFKAMSAANEEALKELNKTSEDFKNITVPKLKRAEDENTRFQTRLREMQSSRDKIFTAKTQLERAKERESKDLQEMLCGMRKELDEATRKAQMSGAGELAAKEEMKEQAEVATLAQDKYERELVLHAKDVEALTAIKAQLQNYTSNVDEVDKRAEAAENQLTDYQASWEQQKKMLSAETKKIEARCADLVNQNSVLHGQLEKLSAQVAASKRTFASVPTPAGASDKESEKSIEELWEIIRFVRREKEIAETKCELSQTESTRYQQRCEYQEKQLENAQQTLNVKSQSQPDVLTAVQHADVIKKMEKLNELTENNKVLTDQKHKLEQKIKGLETKIQKIESEFQPLKDSNRSLTSQKDSLLAEKTALKNEILRWTAKTNQLLEQYKHIDPDEHRKLTEGRRQMLQQMAILKTETQKAKAQVESLKSDASKAQGEAVGLKVEAKKSQEQLEIAKRESHTEMTKTREELESLRKSVEGKTEEINEKIKTLNQVKRIARRYKIQYDELRKSTGDSSKQPEAEGETTTTAAAATTTTTAAAAESPPMETASLDVSSYENRIKELSENVKRLESEVKKFQETNEQKETMIKEKDDKNKRVLMQVREKLQQLTGQRDKVNTEIEEMKKREKAAVTGKEAMTQRTTELEMRLQVLKSQYEGKLARQEKELKELKEAKEEKVKKVEEMQEQREQLQQSMKTEVDQLMQKNQQLQKQIQQQQMKIAVLTAASAVTRPAPGESPGAEVGASQDGAPHSVAASAPITSSAPPTAAIKPTTTPSPSSAIKPSATPKASVRPMTVSPAATTPTPTATVLPTVTPTSTAQESAARVALSQSTSVPATVSVRPITSSVSQSSQPIDLVLTTPEFVVSSLLQDTGEASVSSSAEPERPLTITTAVVSGKRQREDNDAAERPSSGEEEFRTHREPRVKKVKMILTDVDITDELTFESDLSEQQTEFRFQPQEQEERHQLQQQVHPQEQLEGLVVVTDSRERIAVQPTWTDQGSPEVVLIESDNDDDDNDEDNREEELEREEEFEEEGEEEEMGEEEEYEEYGVEDEEEPENEEDVGDDIVEVIDEEPEEDEEEQEGMEEDEDKEETFEEETERLGQQEDLGEDDVPAEAAGEEDAGSRPEDSVPDVDEDEVIREEPSSTQARPSTSVPRQSEAVPSGRTAVTEGRPRLLSARHMAPFSFPQGHPAPGTFDETDDCQVPSTPTLFVPKRTDGFAEAVSSPHLHRPFSFAPPGESSSSMEQWALESVITEEGLRVDDTRVDLMGSTEENSSSGRRASLAVATGPEPTRQSNPTPTSTTTDSRQPSLESMEGDTELSSIVPTITVTASRPQSVEPSEEGAEQNVPVSRARAESIEQEVIELIDEEGEESQQVSESGDTEGKGELEAELELEDTEESVEAKPRDNSGPGTSVESVSADSSAGPSSTQTSSAEAQPSTSSGAASSSQDSTKPKGPAVQLKRSGTSTTWSTSRGGQQRRAQPGHARGQADGRVRKIRRFPAGGPGAQRGRGSRPGRGGRGLHRGGM